VKLWAAGQQGEQTGRWPLVDEEGKELQGRGIDPVHILDNEQHRLRCRQRQQQRHDGVEGLLFLPLRGQGQGRIGIGKRHGQESGPERYGFRQGQAIAPQRRLELLELRLGRLVPAKLQRPLRQIDHRIQGAVPEIRRTATFPAGMGFTSHLLLHGHDQAGLADARFTAEQDDLPQTVPRLRPALAEHRHFRLPPHQGRKAAGAHHVQPTLRPALPQHTIDLDRRGYTLKALGAKVVTGKKPLDQPIRRGTEHDRIGIGQCLQPRRNVGRVPQSQRFLPAAASDLAYHDQTRVNPHTHGYLDAPFAHQTRIEVAQGVDHAEPGADGALSVVLMRLGIAKVDQQAVAQVLGDIAVKAADHLGARLLIGPDHLPPVFGIEVRGEGGRVHQITKQHRELPALGLWSTRFCMSRHYVGGPVGLAVRRS
jgi:hypothetical protein